MANELITLQELATWTQSTVEALQDDPFALDVWAKTSELAREVAEQPTWTIDTAPFKVRLLVLKLAKRTYLNPDQEISTSTGPISSRVLDVAALAMDLSEEEEELLESYQPGADAAGGLWTASIGFGNEKAPGTLYVQTLPQENLGDTLSWDFPFLDPYDMGGE